MNLRFLVIDIARRDHSCGAGPARPRTARPAGPARRGRTVARVAAGLVAIAAAIGPATADAQSYLMNARRLAPPAPVVQAQPADARHATGPLVYVTDAAGELSTVTLGSYTVRRVGAEGAALTDIAFAPNGQLYGVSFTSFYRVDRTTGQTTFIGNLGISDANALVFNARGEAFTAGSNDSELYSIDIRTGGARPIGSTSPYNSAGDLTFYNGFLVLAGYTGGNVNGPDALVQLNPASGRPVSYANLNVADLFGLVSTGHNLLFGFAGTNLYQLFPNQSNINKRAVLRKNLAASGVAQIYGAAYDGAFQN